MLRKKAIIGAVSAAFIAIGLASPVFGSSTSHASQPKFKGSPIAIGFETSLTGSNSTGRALGLAAAEAEVDQQNAKGGINGHKLVLDVADDTSSAAGALTATQALVSEGVVGITDPASTEAGAAQQYADAQGVPWSVQCVTATLTADPNVYCDNLTNGVDEPVPTVIPESLKAQHITTMGGMAPGAGVISASAAASVLNTLLAAKQCCNIATAITDVSPTSTQTDFTSDALAVKNANPGAVFIAFQPLQQELASQALRQQGYTGIIIDNTSSTEEAYITSPTFNGVYQADWYRPPSSPVPADLAFRQALKKYAHNEFGGYTEAASWIGVNLLITALLKVKGTPTGRSVASAIATIKSWDGGGLLPQTVNFTVPNRDRNSRNIQKCFWLMKIVNGKLKSTNGGKAICGPLEGLPGQ